MSFKTYELLMNSSKLNTSLHTKGKYRGPALANGVKVSFIATNTHRQFGCRLPSCATQPGVACHGRAQHG